MTQEVWFAKWKLEPDGEPIVTRNSRLFPVRRDGEPLILKIAPQEEERRGGEVMVYYAGQGAVRVIAHEDEALLLERSGAARLVEMAQRGRDDERRGMIAAFGKLKKAELARTATQALKDTGWLPDLLITPTREGAFAVTAKGKQALAGSDTAAAA